MLKPVLEMPMSPFRLSGTVYGALLNHTAALAVLGDAANAAPYKAPPKAPVLFIKPRNTLLAPGAPVTVPADAGEYEVGASLGIVIGRTACRVSEAQAMEFIAGYTLVVDFSVPHESFYRPSVRFKARDGSCYLGPRVVPVSAVTNPDALTMTVSIDGQRVQQTSTAGMVRPVAKLIADVTDFMTLRPGDVLMLGVAHGAPKARPGHRVSVTLESVGSFETILTAESRERVA